MQNKTERSPQKFGRSMVIEPLESRLLFSATTDFAILDHGYSDLDFIIQEAQSTDLLSVLNISDQTTPQFFETTKLSTDQIFLIGEDLASSDVTQLVFVDTTLENYQILVSDILEENSGESIQVVLLDGDSDGVAQITEYLTQYSELSSIHILSHGSQGQIELGSTTLAEATLDLYETDLTSWANALADHADILFYGCNIASTPSGLTLINSIAELTEADVAASDDITGNSIEESNWVLEYTAGDISTQALFHSDSVIAWQGLLATPSATADVTNVWIGETVTGNVLDGTGGTGIVADTLGDGTTEISSVTYNAVVYDSWVDDQLTINADSGTFVIQRDGTFTYTATADGTTASPYSEPTWLETYNLYAYEQGVSHESGGNLNLSGYNNNYLYQSSLGLGINSHPYSDGIDFTWTGHSSEVLVVDLGAEYTNAQIALSNLGAGEIAYWEVYGDDFVSIATGSATNTSSLTISDGSGFRYIAFTADEWDGVAPTWTDFRVFEVSAYQTTPADDVFTYTIEDDSLNTSSNTLTISYVNDNVNGRIAYNATSTAEGGTASVATGTTPITDSDGANTPTYQWIRSADGNTGWENIEGATTNSYTMTSEDVNQYVRLRATYTDDQGTIEQVSTYVLGPITNTSADAGSISDITGTQTELQTLSAGSITDSDTVASAVIYQWQRSDSGTGNWSDISGATSSTYQLEDTDANQYIRVTATYTDGTGDSEWVASNSTGQITDINQAPILGSDDSINVNENTTTVGNYAGTDPDAIDSISYSLSGTDAALFTIDASGNLAFLSGRDFETYSDSDSNGVYEVTITATDDGAGALTNSQNISVTIDDVNENPVLGADAAVNVNENTTTVGNYAATDVDAGQTISYSLSGNDAALFSIDASGNLSFTSGRDFETYSDNDSNGVYEVTITATDDGAGALTDTQNISVTIDDVNENPVLGADAAVNVDENTTTVGNYAATDVDAGQTISYSLSGTDAALFSIDAAGNLSFTTGRDFETYSDNDSNGVYEVTITATDDGAGALTDTQNISVTIDDVNENPVLGADAAVNVNENTTTVGNYAASDVDAGQTISYSLSGNDAALFSIDASGNVSFTSSRDFETYSDNDANGIYEVTITATDDGAGALTDTQNVSVTIDDVNEYSIGAISNISSGTNIISEFSNSGDTVGIHANALDADSGDSITYTLLDNAGGRFNINPSTGIVTVMDETLLDFELNASHQIIIQANSTDGSFSTQSFIINIENRNDAGVLTLVGNPTEDEVLSATVNDPDGLTGSITYSWQRSLDGNTWSTITNDNSADGSQYQLTDTDPGNFIRVTAIYIDDGGFSESLVTNTESAVVNINDIPNVTVSGVATQNEILIATVSDEDGISNTIQYQWQLSTDGIQWQDILNANTQQLSLSNNEVGGFIRVATQYIDNGGTNETAFSAATATVVNINDAPTLVTALSDQILDEDTPFLIQINLSAFDDIDGDILVLSATLSDGSPLPSWLQFDASSGQFFGTPTVTEVGPHDVQITATDPENFTATDNLIITVNEVNDTPIAILSPTINNTEDTRDDVIDLRSLFVDEEDSAADLAFQLLNNSNTHLVRDAQINQSTGELTIHYVPDGNGLAHLTIGAIDSAGATTQTNITVNISPVNDAPVSESPQLISVDLNIQQDSELDLTNLFNDLEDGHQLTYSIVSNSNPDLTQSLSIDQATAQLQAQFNQQMIGEAVVVVRATDSEGEYSDLTVTLQTLSSKPQIEQPNTVNTNNESSNQTDIVDTPATNSDNKGPDTNQTTIDNGGTTEPSTDQSNGTASPESLDRTLGLQGRQSFLDTSSQIGRAISAQEVNDLLKPVMEKQIHKQKLYESKQSSADLPSLEEKPFISLVDFSQDNQDEEDIIEFKKTFSRIKEEISDTDEDELIPDSVYTGLTVSLTTGLMVWSLRASSFLFTLFSMTPLWKGFDPLPVVSNELRTREKAQQRKDQKDEDKDSHEVGYLFDHTSNNHR